MAFRLSISTCSGESYCRIIMLRLAWDLAVRIIADLFTALFVRLEGTGDSAFLFVSVAVENIDISGLTLKWLEPFVAFAALLRVTGTFSRLFRALSLLRIVRAFFGVGAAYAPGP